MYKITDVKELRERTGAGMMDCKKALEANDGDIDKSIDWLREKGIAKAAKKESRIAAEGTCQIKVDGNTCVMVEVNSETDFVAKNEEFTKFVDYIVDQILANPVNTLEEALEIKDGNETINDKLIALVAKIGEKISFRRFEKITKNDDEVFGTYKHMGGKIGAVIVVKGANEEVAKDVAMQTAAMNPTALNRAGVPQEDVDRESKVIKEQVMAEGKPEEIAEKMVVGRLNKFYKEVCLEEQAFIKDSGVNVKDYVKNNGGEIISMTRFAVGEGIEKKQENFADEVMSQIQNS
ncbi:MAG: translation elongation factor Ts [Bacilli bacterium]|nr:translation elongation factor Ts [Bacilli bacterium]